MKAFFKREWAKLRKMSFAEKRWYLWEYYKLHFAGIILVIFLLGYLVNWRLNPPPDEYVYIAWLGVAATTTQLENLAAELSVIVEDPERQIIQITDYSLSPNPQMNDALQARFVAFLHLGALDVFISTREAANEMAHFGYIRTIDEVMDYLAQINPRLDLEDRLLLLTFDHEYTENEFFDPDAEYFIGISLAGSPVLEEFGIDSSIAYLCVIINTRRLYEIAELLEVLLYGA